MTFWSVDRLEGSFAVCERPDGRMVQIALTELPAAVREGSVLRVSQDGRFSLDLEEENRRREEALRLQLELFGREE